jgi:hypothetical protein
VRNHQVLGARLARSEALQDFQILAEFPWFYKVSLTSLTGFSIAIFAFPAKCKSLPAFSFRDSNLPNDNNRVQEIASSPSGGVQATHAA